jgi:hypothetical protein
VVYVCNPSYVGDGDQEDHGYRDLTLFSSAVFCSSKTKSLLVNHFDSVESCFKVLLRLIYFKFAVGLMEFQWKD